VLVAAGLTYIRLLFENRGQRRARIFRIDIDSSGKNGLLADECASQIKAALDGQMSAGFNDLSEDFSENELLGEILGADHNAIRMAFATRDREKKQEDQKCADDLRKAGADGINRQ
jgi:hypothetical protein